MKINSPLELVNLTTSERNSLTPEAGYSFHNKSYKLNETWDGDKWVNEKFASILTFTRDSATQLTAIGIDVTSYEGGVLIVNETDYHYIETVTFSTDSVITIKGLDLDASVTSVNLVHPNNVNKVIIPFSGADFSTTSTDILAESKLPIFNTSVLVATRIDTDTPGTTAPVMDVLTGTGVISTITLNASKVYGSISSTNYVLDVTENYVITEVTSANTDGDTGDGIFICFIVDKVL